ncbi:hypothetical protein ACTFIV_005428 [Dictyostelium citrinum]
MFNKTGKCKSFDDGFVRPERTISNVDGNGLIDKQKFYSPSPQAKNFEKFLKIVFIGIHKLGFYANQYENNNLASSEDRGELSPIDVSKINQDLKLFGYGSDSLVVVN